MHIIHAPPPNNFGLIFCSCAKEYSQNGAEDGKAIPFGGLCDFLCRPPEIMVSL